MATEFQIDRLKLVALIILLWACMCHGVYSEDGYHRVTQAEDGVQAPKHVPKNKTQETTENGSDLSIVVPKRLSGGESKGAWHRHARSEPPSHPLHYLISLDGTERHIQLKPNPNIISPGAVVEWRSGEAAAGEGPLLGSVRTRRMAHATRLCHYTGRVAGQPDSVAALSTCNGLAGYVRIKNTVYTIEPMGGVQNRSSGQEHPHLVKRAHGGPERASKPNCLTDNGFTTAGGHPSRSDQQQDTTGKDLHLQTLIAVDKSTVDAHKDIDLDNYILTIFNMANSLFQDMDSAINLELVRLIRLDDENDKMNAAVSKRDIDETLAAFADWQADINPSEDESTVHHDVAVLITRRDLCSRWEGGVTCGLVGMAKTGGACQGGAQAAVCHDSGLKTGYILAHEIAHTLGIGHDTGSVNGSCDSRLPDGSSTVMSPKIFVPTGWSRCSRDALAAFIKNNYKCLTDEPEDHNFDMPEVLPGVMYGADFQCRQLLGPEAKQCSSGSTCHSLNCKVGNSQCMKTGVPPASGTKCGDKMWCYKRECIWQGERLDAVDGGWGSWSGWSGCSRSCGSGVSTAARRCDTPRPSRGGKPCHGTRHKHKICAHKPCQIGTPSFRDVQCSEFDSWVFPEDRKTHIWKSVHIQGENPCALYCFNEDGNVAVLKTKVTDGTTCLRGLRDICIGGECKEVPCDLQLESGAVEDVCGICHGNGIECKLVEGLKEFSEAGTHSVIKIPAGTRNIKAEEVEPSKATLLVKSSDGSTIYSNRKKLGYFQVPGTYAWSGMIGKNQELLNIPGPVSKDLQIMVINSEPVAVKYSMGLPSKKREAHYSWDFVDWTDCSSRCGNGTQESVPKCVEQMGGLVEDIFCEKFEKPSSKFRACNLGPCIPRWSIGEWHECGPCPSENAKHFRTVNCVIPIAEAESEFVESSRCSGPKPKTEEYCSCKTKRQSAYRLLPNQKINYNKGGLKAQIFPDFIRPNHIVDEFNKQLLPLATKSEPKVTLLQLENESEKSMLKQFKENQLKNNIPVIIIKGKHYGNQDISNLVSSDDASQNDNYRNLKQKRNMNLRNNCTPNDISHLTKHLSGSGSQDTQNNIEYIFPAFNSTNQEQSQHVELESRKKRNKKKMGDGPSMKINNSNVGTSLLNLQLYNSLPNLEDVNLIVPSAHNLWCEEKDLRKVHQYQSRYRNAINTQHFFEKNQPSHPNYVSNRLHGTSNGKSLTNKINVRRHSKKSHPSSLLEMYEELKANGSYPQLDHSLIIRSIRHKSTKPSKGELLKAHRPFNVRKREEREWNSDNDDHIRKIKNRISSLVETNAYENENNEKYDVVNTCASTTKPTTEKPTQKFQAAFGNTAAGKEKCEKLHYITDRPSSTDNSCEPSTEVTDECSEEMTADNTTRTKTEVLTTTPVAKNEIVTVTTTECTMTELAITDRICTTDNSTMRAIYEGATLGETCSPPIQNYKTKTSSQAKHRLSGPLKNSTHRKTIEENYENYDSKNTRTCILKDKKADQNANNGGRGIKVKESNNDKVIHRSRKDEARVKRNNDQKIYFARPYIRLAQIPFSNAFSNVNLNPEGKKHEIKPVIRKRDSILDHEIIKTKMNNTNKESVYINLSDVINKPKSQKKPNQKVTQEEFVPEIIIHPKNVELLKLVGKLKNLNNFENKNILTNTSTNPFHQNETNQNLIERGLENVQVDQTSRNGGTNNVFTDALRSKSARSATLLTKHRDPKTMMKTNYKNHMNVPDSYNEGLENNGNNVKNENIGISGSWDMSHQVTLLDNPNENSEKNPKKSITSERKIRALNSGYQLENELKLKQILELVKMQKDFPERHISKRSTRKNNYIHFEKLMHDFGGENPNEFYGNTDDGDYTIRPGKINDSFLKNIITAAPKSLKNQKCKAHLKEITKDTRL